MGVTGHNYIRGKLDLVLTYQVCCVSCGTVGMIAAGYRDSHEHFENLGWIQNNDYDWVCPICKEKHRCDI